MVAAMLVMMESTPCSTEMIKVLETTLQAASVSKNEAAVCEVLKALIDVVQGHPGVMRPHIEAVCTAMLTIVNHGDFDDDTRRLPIVVISAFAAGGDLDRAYEAGADTFLSKPVQIRRLLDLVDRLVGYRSDEPTTKATA